MALRRWMMGLDVERAKAILATDEGVMVLNLREGMISEHCLGDAAQLAYENRLELIDSRPLDAAALEAEWRACLLEARQ